MRYGGGGGTKTAQQCDPFFHRALTHYPLDWRGFTGQKSSQIRTKQHVFDIFSTHIQTDAISGPKGRPGAPAFFREKLLVPPYANGEKYGKI